MKSTLSQVVKIKNVVKSYRKFERQKYAPTLQINIKEKFRADYLEVVYETIRIKRLGIW